MNWYLAKIIFQIICGSGNHTPQFDEQLRLIVADEQHEALTKAKKIGEDEQESFFNERQQLVKWQFIDVAELYRLSNMIDGAEIFPVLKNTITLNHTLNSCAAGQHGFSKPNHEKYCN